MLITCPQSSDLKQLEQSRNQPPPRGTFLLLGLCSKMMVLLDLNPRDQHQPPVKHKEIYF